MTASEIIQQIKSSHKYRSICDETIQRITRSKIGQYQSDKATIKSIKTKLHQITQAFVSENSILKANHFLDELNSKNLNPTVKAILTLHASSKERLDFAEQLYADIFSKVGSHHQTVLDIACGFNPFLLPTLHLPIKRLIATDINASSVNLLNRYFQLINFSGHATSSDILETIPNQPVDLCLLFKILPLLEQQQKGFSKTLINNLPAQHFAITFPTKTLSGKNIGMPHFYRTFITNTLPSSQYDYLLEKSYPNELLFIIKKSA